jgi:integrase
MAVLVECLCHRRQSVKNKRCYFCGEDLVKLKRSNKAKYWITYRLPGGKQRFEKMKGEEASSLEFARDAEDKRKVQKRENRIFDIKPETTMTFNELTEWYLNLEKVKACDSYKTKKICLSRFNEEFGNMIVSKMKRTDLENYQAKRKKEGRADNTIDQQIGEARTMVNKAFDDDKVSGDTLKVFRMRKMLKRNANARSKILSLDQFGELMACLPVHCKAALAIAFYTGMRKSEILKGLTWDKVLMKDRVINLEANDTKDDEPRMVPICDGLYEILKALPRGIHDNHVILYKGRPIRDIRTTLSKACERARILYGRFKKDGFVFHDLRHTFNTYMRKAGVDQSVIMQITGHSTREMFDRYNTVDEDDAKEAMKRFQGFVASVDQNVDQTLFLEVQGK